MAITLWQIKTKIWQEMEVNSDSSTYNTDRLRDMVNEVGLEILEWKVANELTNKYIQWNILNFNKWKFAKTLISPKPLTDEVEIADTEILFDTTNYPTVWAILLGNEVITYTWKAADRITWVTWILSWHQKGTIVQPLYIVPADFWKPLKVYKFFDNKETEILYKDNINNLERYYEIKEWYLFFYWVLAWDTYYIEYTKKYVNLEDDTDETIFPDHIALNIIPFICWGRMIKDEVLRVKLLSQWYNKLATEFAKQWEDIWKPKWINWKRFWFNSIR